MIGVEVLTRAQASARKDREAAEREQTSLELSRDEAESEATQLTSELKNAARAAKAGRAAIGAILTLDLIRSKQIAKATEAVAQLAAFTVAKVRLPAQGIEVSLRAVTASRGRAVEQRRAAQQRQAASEADGLARLANIQIGRAALRVLQGVALHLKKAALTVAGDLSEVLASTATLELGLAHADLTKTTEQLAEARQELARFSAEIGRCPLCDSELDERTQVVLAERLPQ